MHRSPRSVLSCLPTTLAFVTLEYLSPVHDPPEAVEQFIHRLPNLRVNPRVSYHEAELDDEDFEDRDGALFGRVDAARERISAYLKARNIPISEEEARELLFVDFYEFIRFGHRQRDFERIFQ